MVLSLTALAVPPFGLRPGIEFTGGTAMTVQFSNPVGASDIRRELESSGNPGGVVQALGGDSFFIRVGELSPEVLDDEGRVVDAGGRARVENALGNLSAINVVSYDAVSAVVGAETVRNAIIAIAVASVAILLYVSWAFRRVPSPFRYGAAAIVALLHDVIVVLGLFALLGKLAEIEVNAMFIIGVLTVIGYSVNDTIVVFDRARENVLRHPGMEFAEIMNLSIRDTIGRSLNTSLTLLIVIGALLLFGGATIRPLLWVLMTGVVIGTYSSIFVAGLLLVAWETGEIGRAVRHLPLLRRR